MAGNKSFTVLFVLILLVILGAVVYQSQIKPYRDLVKEQEETISEQEEKISELESQVSGNYTGAVEEEEKHLNIFTILLLVGFLGSGLYILYLKLLRPQNEEKELEEALRHFRGTMKEGYTDGYWYKMFGEKLYKHIYYHCGYYFGNHKFPIALIVFSANPSWHGQGEPALEWMRGIVYSKHNFKKIIEVFIKGDVTLNDMLKYMTDTSNARRGVHYAPVSLENYQQEALMKIAKEKEDFFTDVNKQIAVQQAVEGVL